MTDPNEILCLFRICHSAASVNIKGVTDEEALVSHENRGNHMNWILGHIVISRDVILNLVGEEKLLTPKQSEPYKRGANPEGQLLPFGFTQVIEYYNNGQKRLKVALEGMTAEQLEAVDPDSGDEGQRPPLYSSLLFLHFHEAYHVGQLGMLRRMIGKEGAIQ